MHVGLSSANAMQGALLCAFVAFCACAVILKLLLRTGLAWRIAMDVPNDRSLHTKPTPRIGGWGIVPALAVLIGVGAANLRAVALIALCLAVVSQIDDRRGLSARLRFGCHIAAVIALIAVYPAGVVWPVLVVTGFLLVWLINLYNFMDGSDGLAGGMAVFGFGGYAIAALTGAHPDASLGLGAASVAGAAAGFLLVNFHPAKVFLGDAGSIPLGFLAGAIGYLGWRNGAWPIWFAPMVFSPFIGDASVTLLKRLARGEKFWQAHREHYYQRMVQAGLGHARTACMWYAVMAIGTLIAIYSLRLSVLQQWLTVLAWAFVLMLAGLGVDRNWRRYLIRSRQS